MYYFIEIVDTTSGIAKAITEKQTLDLAKMTLHQTLASAMANENVHSCLCIIINQIGSIQQHEYWARMET